MVHAAMPDVPPHTASTVIDLLDAVTRTVLVQGLGHPRPETVTPDPHTQDPQRRIQRSAARRPVGMNSRG
jgi:hypothetical protein